MPKFLRHLVPGLIILLGLVAAWTWLSLSWSYAEGERYDPALALWVYQRARELFLQM